MLSDVQIEIAVKFWSNLFNKQVTDVIIRDRFERALRRIITRNRAAIQSISLQVIPHYILALALKEIKASVHTFPFRKLEISFPNGEVYLFERDKFIKSLSHKDCVL